MNVKELSHNISQWLTNENLDNVLGNQKDNLVDILTIYFSNYESPFSSNDNPFIKFIQALKKSSGQDKLSIKDLTSLEIIPKLYNLLEDGIILSKDLKDTSNILFRKSLWENNPEYKDLKFVVQAFYWLQDKNNIEKFFGNRNARVGKLITDGSKIRKATDVKDLIQRKDIIPEETSQKVVKTFTPSTRIKNYDRWEQLQDLDDLSDSEVNDLVSYLIVSRGLNK